MSLYPMQGMGSNGLGMAAGGGLGGAGGISPQLLALLSQMGMGGGGMPNAMPGNPLMPGAAGTPGSPMSSFIGAHPALAGMIPGAGGMGGGVAPTQQLGPNATPQGLGQAMAGQQGQPGTAGGLGGMMSNPQQLMSLLAALKGSQTGVPPGNPGSVPSSGMQPGTNIPNQAVSGLGAPGANPNLMLALRNLGMFGGITGGAPT